MCDLRSLGWKEPPHGQHTSQREWVTNFIYMEKWLAFDSCYHCGDSAATLVRSSVRGFRDVSLLFYTECNALLCLHRSDMTLNVY